MTMQNYVSVAGTETNNIYMFDTCFWLWLTQMVDLLRWKNVNIPSQSIWQFCQSVLSLIDSHMLGRWPEV